MSTAAQALTTEQRAKFRYWLSEPNRFIKGFNRSELWPKQAEIVDSVFRNQRTSVKACHASGKTHVAANIGMTFLAAFTEAIVLTTAPTWPQVEKLLWGEVHALMKQSIYPWPKALTTELRLGPKRYMYGVSTSVEKKDEGVKIQGLHAKNVLIIVDEAPGVDPKILEGLEGALSAGNTHILEIGNPTIPSGPFADTFGRDRSLWNAMTISAFDTPNLAGLTIDDLKMMAEHDPDELMRNPIPYLISRKWVLDMYRKHGENGLFYKSRVKGEFPDQSEDSLFSITKLEHSRDRKHDKEFSDRGSLTGGLDVAGPGESDTVLVLRDGPDIVFKLATADADPRGKVANAILHEIGKDRISNINVDSVGIGWGMYLHLNDLGIPCTPINVGITDSGKVDLEKYTNLKAQLYWGLHERLEEGDLGGLDDDDIAQLATIRYEHTARGQVKIESKEDMAARGVRSPDHAEAVMLSFAGGLDVWERL